MNAITYIKFNRFNHCFFFTDSLTFVSCTHLQTHLIIYNCWS